MSKGVIMVQAKDGKLGEIHNIINIKVDLAMVEEKIQEKIQKKFKKKESKKSQEDIIKNKLLYTIYYILFTPFRVYTFAIYQLRKCKKIEFKFLYLFNAQYQLHHGIYKI